MEPKRIVAEKSDYVLAKGPDGKRVWIHKKTGEIRTSLPAADGAGFAPAAASTAPQAAVAAAPPQAAAAAASLMSAAAQGLSGGNSEPGAVSLQMQMQETMRQLANKIQTIQAQPEAPRAAPTDLGLGALQKPSGTLDPSLAARLGAPRPPGAAGGAAPQGGMLPMPGQPAPEPEKQRVVSVGGVKIMTMQKKPTFKPTAEQQAAAVPPPATNSIADAFAAFQNGGAIQTGALADVNLELASANNTLLGEDFDLFAGNISAEEYNIKLQQHAVENAASTEATQAATLAALAAAAQTNSTATGADLAGMASMAGFDPSALMAAMAANMAGADGAVDTNSMNLEALTQAAQASHAAGGIPTEAGGDPADPNSAGMDVAMAAQLMQLNRFHMQQRVFETQKCIASGDMPTRFKEGFRPMQLCKQFVKSASCVRGETCSYAHTFEELHPMSQELPGAQSAKALEALEENEPKLEDVPEPAMRMQRKRAMCQRLQRNQCLLGNKCPFAHHESELGTVALAITDRVKTQLCKFFEQNKCVYGKYCVNAHGVKEIGKPKPEYLCPPSKQDKPNDYGMGGGGGYSGGSYGGAGRDDRDRRRRD